MRPSCLAVMLLGCVLPVAAQTPAEYRASGERYYQSVNPHHLFLLFGTDTTGAPLRGLSVERHSWTETDTGFRVIVRQDPIDISGVPRTDTLDIASNGRVRAVNGKTELLRGRFDFVPRFPVPARALRRGDTWADTVRTELSGPISDYAFVVERRYTVGPVVDTLDRRLTEITATATVRYRDAWWADSAAGSFVWMDLSGPMNERILFDEARGELVMQTWSMRLSGAGGISGQADTLEAGLISSQTRVQISEDRAEMLLRPLPIGDTSITVRLGSNPGTIFLHTIRRTGDTLSSGFIRPDGFKATTSATYTGGQLVRYEALWTNEEEPRSITIARSGETLQIDDGGPIAIPIAGDPWAVADYGMPELLIRLFQSLPIRDTTNVSIYRPVPRTWDTLTVTTSQIPNGLLVVAWPTGNASAATTYLIVDDGDLLFAESMAGSGSQFVPRPGSHRRARLERLMQTFR